MKKQHHATMHSDGFRKAYPAVNVKVYSFGRGLSAETFKCSQEDFDRAMGFAFDMACEQFWRDVQEYLVDPCFKKIGYDAKAYSAGRSNGWVEVHGLPDPEDWDAELIQAWEHFEEMCDNEVKFLSGDGFVCETIESNEWTKPGSELYNFVDGLDGKPKCIADLKAEAIAARFGPVVRRHSC